MRSSLMEIENITNERSRTQSERGWEEGMRPPEPHLADREMELCYDLRNPTP